MAVAAKKKLSKKDEERIDALAKALRQTMFAKGLRTPTEVAAAIIDELEKSKWRIHKKRENNLPRTAVKSKKADKKLSAAIRAYKRAHPEASHQEIGDHFGVNTGRVSEALNYKR